MTKRPPQGRGSGGRVTPSAKTAAAEAAAADQAASASKRRARVPRSTKARTTSASSAAGSDATTEATGRTRRSATGTTMDEHAIPEADAVDTPVWGMGDMVIWWLVSIAATLVFQVVVGGYLISSGTFVAFWPNEEGWAIGEVVGKIGTGQEPSVTVGLNAVPLWLQTVFRLPLWITLIAGPVYVARKKGLSLRHDFGLAAKAVDVPVGLAIGIACQLILIPAVYSLLFLLAPEQDVSAAARALTDRADDFVGVLALIIIVGVGAPIAEEIFYRGLSQHAIAKRYGPRLGVLLGAAFFAASHLQVLQFLGLFAFGLVLGGLTRRVGRLGPAIFAHIGFNLTAAVVLVWNLPLA